MAEATPPHTLYQPPGYPRLPAVRSPPPEGGHGDCGRSAGGGYSGSRLRVHYLPPLHLPVSARGCPLRPAGRPPAPPVGGYHMVG